MSITTELRNFVDELACHRCTRDMLREIADRIDQEHESAVIGAMNDALSYANDKDMAELGWVRLPKDAEGVPFRVGDHVEVPDGPPDAGRPNVRGMIVALKLGVVTWHIHVKLPSGNTTRHLVENVHHVHVPTVEDVLREMVAAYMDTPLDDSNNGEFFAEYAAKLRLAGDAE